MIFNIAFNELRRLFLSPLAWIILAIVQFLLAIFFFVLLSSYLEPGSAFRGRGLTEIVVIGMLQIAGLLLVLVCPFLSMRLFSEEQRSGSLLLLMSSPISVTEMVLGKYLGMILFLSILLLVIALMPFTLLLGSKLDYGQLASGLTGLALLMSTFSAIGLFASTLTRQPAAAGVSAFAVIFLLWIIHIAGNTGNEQMTSVFSYLSMLRHYNNLLSGMFSSVDVIYYILLSSCFIVLSIWRLDAMRSYH